MEFYHRHIFDISESHSVRLPEDKIFAPTMRLAEKIIFQGALKWNVTIREEQLFLSEIVK